MSYNKSWKRNVFIDTRGTHTVEDTTTGQQASAQLTQPMDDVYAHRPCGRFCKNIEHQINNWHRTDDRPTERTARKFDWHKTHWICGDANRFPHEYYKFNNLT